MSSELRTVTKTPLSRLNIIFSSICDSLTGILPDPPSHRPTSPYLYLFQTFRMVEYEDELDLLTVVVTRREESGEAAVCLHDNNNGAIMKRIPLQESWDEVSH